MSSLSKLGLGLSVVFTCLLLALVAEVYYLLWWKGRILRRKIEDDYNHQNKEFFYKFCGKKTVKSSVISVTNPTNNTSITPNQESPSNDQVFQFDNKDYYGPTELILGQPRFLFTIKEETKEDLESDDGKSITIREGKRSLSDLLNTVENNNATTTITTTTPYLTPLSSPQFVTPPITPLGSSQSSQSGGYYNPFYESSNDAEFSKIVRASPPPKFKFLRDAEEKLQRRIMLFEQAKNNASNLHNKIKEENIATTTQYGPTESERSNMMQTTTTTITTQYIPSEVGKIKEENDGSFITIIVGNNNENDKKINHHYHSPHCISGDSSSCSTSTSQILPLASSPSHLPPSNRKFMNFLTL